MEGYCVYKHTAPSGRVYIGISTNPNRRWNKGKGYQDNPYFWRCIQKYGWENIVHEILFENLSIEEAKKKEKEQISFYKSNLRRYGYNISSGGDCAPSKESRKRMSKSRKGNTNCVGRELNDSTKNKIAESLREYYKSHDPSFIGRHHTPDTIKKLSERIVSDETREKMRKNHAVLRGASNPSAKPIDCFSVSGEFIKHYEYATQAKNELGIDLSLIIKVCKGKNKQCKGYVFRYSETK